MKKLADELVEKLSNSMGFLIPLTERIIRETTAKYDNTEQEEKQAKQEADFMLDILKMVRAIDPDKFVKDYLEIVPQETITLGELVLLNEFAGYIKRGGKI